MIGVDTNILLHAHRSDSQWHDQARSKVAALANQSSPWAIPWPCVHEFLAIATHPQVFATPTPPELAIDQVRAWFESPSLVTLGEGPGYMDLLASLMTSAKTRGPRVHDARIAAICLYNGVSELWTADRDFLAFPALNIRNPLVA